MPQAMPMPQSAPQQAAWQQAPPPVPPSQPKGHRGLWMGLGALVAVGVLAFAAFQVPKFFGTKADTAQQHAAAQSEPAPSQPMPQSAVTPEQTAVPAPAESLGETQAAPAQAEPPVPPPGKAVRAASMAAPVRAERSTTGARAVSSQQAPAASAQQEASAPPPVPQASAAAQPAVDAAALAEARDRLRLLSARSNAASRTLKTLEASQRASGLGLRGDISAAWDRTNDSLDEAKAAIQGSDVAGAKRALDNAERDLDRLDKFLGR
jgi:hypothetical protein